MLDRSEDFSNMEDIPLSAAVDHQQACLHIWTNDHPPRQIIGNPSAGIQTRSSTNLSNQCQYVAFMSSIEHRIKKEDLQGPNWIFAMQEELDEFERNRV